MPPEKCLGLDDAQYVPPGRRDGREGDQEDPIEPPHPRLRDGALQYDELQTCAHRSGAGEFPEIEDVASRAMSNDASAFSGTRRRVIRVTGTRCARARMLPLA